MQGNYVGKITGGKEVLIGKDSPNQHMIITGISGAGKSVRIADIERHIIGNRGTIVAIDINGTHEEINDEKYCHISAQEDGIDLQFLNTSLVETGQESTINLLQYALETICPRQLRGACQLTAVRNALKYAIEHRKDFATEMEAIAHGLEEQDSQPAAGAYNHLCDILEGNFFRKSSKKFEEGKLNILSLRGINSKTQKRIIEIFLSAIWRGMRMSDKNRKTWTIVLDEFQSLTLKRDSVLFQMLTEARKYGISLILATQTLSNFTKSELSVINQASTKLFFRQSITDVRKIAELIEPKHKEKWSSELSHLRIGEAITIGSLEISGRPINRPIITRSEYKKPENLLRRV